MIMPTTRSSRRLTKHNDVGGILATLDSNIVRQETKKEAKKDETLKCFKKIATSSTPDSSDSLSELSDKEERHCPKTLFPKQSTSKRSFPKAISYRLDKGNVDIESDSEERNGDEESGDEDQSYDRRESDIESEVESEDTSENEFEDSEERDESVVSDELSEPEEDDFIDDASEDLYKFSPLPNDKKTKKIEIELDEEYDPDATDEEESEDELDVDEDDQVVATPSRKKKATEVEVVAEILQDTNLASEEDVVVVNEVEENDETDDENSVALENDSDTIVVETDDEYSLNHDDTATADSMSDDSEEESTIVCKDSGDATAAFEEGSDTETLNNAELSRDDDDNDNTEVLNSAFEEGSDTDALNNAEWSGDDNDIEQRYSMVTSTEMVTAKNRPVQHNSRRQKANHYLMLPHRNPSDVSCLISDRTRRTIRSHPSRARIKCLQLRRYRQSRAVCLRNPKLRDLGILLHSSRKP